MWRCDCDCVEAGLVRQPARRACAGGCQNNNVGHAHGRAKKKRLFKTVLGTIAQRRTRSTWHQQHEGRSTAPNTRRRRVLCERCAMATTHANAKYMHKQQMQPCKQNSLLHTLFTGHRSEATGHTGRTRYTPDSTPTRLNNMHLTGTSFGAQTQQPCCELDPTQHTQDTPSTKSTPHNRPHG